MGCIALSLSDRLQETEDGERKLDEVDCSRLAGSSGTPDLAPR